MAAFRSPMVIAHRGASAYRPEHSRGAYELAFRLGADAVEPDIVATKDGVLVLRHENEISGTTDVSAHPEFADRRTTKTVDDVEVTGWFTEDFTWVELSGLRTVERLPSYRQASSSFDGFYPILRLSDLFELVNEQSDDQARLLGIVAELKHATYFSSIGLPLGELFAAELARSGWQNHPALIVESFEKGVLIDLYGRGYRGKRVYLVEAQGAPADRIAADGAAAEPYAADVTASALYALAAAAPAERIDGISVDTRMLSVSTDSTAAHPESEHPDAAHSTAEDIVDSAHAAGLEIFCWTLRPENVYLRSEFRVGSAKSDYGNWLAAFRAVMATGVDGVFADNPDLAIVARSTLR